MPLPWSCYQVASLSQTHCPLLFLTPHLSFPESPENSCPDGCWGGGRWAASQGPFSFLPQTHFIPTVRWLLGLCFQEVFVCCRSQVLGAGNIIWWWQSLHPGWRDLGTAAPASPDPPGAVASVGTAVGSADSAGAGKLPWNLMCQGPQTSFQPGETGDPESSPLCLAEIPS